MSNQDLKVTDPWFRMQGEYTRFFRVKHEPNGWAGVAKLGRIFVIVNTTNRVGDRIFRQREDVRKGDSKVV